MGRFRFAACLTAGLPLIAICRLAAAQPAIEPGAEQVAAAQQAITERALRGHIRFLADDLLEGRGPGSRGDELAQRYIATQFQTLGLKPVAPGGGWLQPVPLVGVTTHAPATLEFQHNGKP